jgi:hypothetical protein
MVSAADSAWVPAKPGGRRSGRQQSTWRRVQQPTTARRIDRRATSRSSQTTGLLRPFLRAMPQKWRPRGGILRHRAIRPPPIPRPRASNPRAGQSWCWRPPRCTKRSRHRRTVHGGWPRRVGKVFLTGLLGCGHATDSGHISRCLRLRRLREWSAIGKTHGAGCPGVFTRLLRWRW